MSIFKTYHPAYTGKITMVLVYDTVEFYNNNALVSRCVFDSAVKAQDCFDKNVRFYRGF